MNYELLPCPISEVFDAFERDGTQRVHPNLPYLCKVSEITQGAYLKMRRTREKALAPDKVNNKTPEDKVAGQAKWDAIYESMRSNGYDYCKPVVFVVRCLNAKRKLHQGHHRVTIAEELRIPIISVMFKFD